jgi:hypothetical protein
VEIPLWFCEEPPPLFLGYFFNLQFYVINLLLYYSNEQTGNTVSHITLFICILLWSVYFTSADYPALDASVISEEWKQKDEKGSGHNLNGEALSQHLLRLRQTTHTQNKRQPDSPMAKFRSGNLQNQSISANHPTVAARVQIGNMKESWFFTLILTCQFQIWI